MKYLHIERIPVRLSVLSPLFIGGGQADVNKKTSVRLPGKPFLLIPDENRLIAALDQLGLLEAYERFLLGPVTASLGDFFAQNGIEVAEDAPWVSYLLECREERIQTLKTFIKQPDGRPYIPGSSIKGAMRTAYLALLMKDGDRQALLGSVNDYPKNRQTGREENPLRLLGLNKKSIYDPVNDLLKGLAVSDSAPIPDGNALVVTRKWDFRAADGSWSEGRMPLLRECLRPGTETAFTLSLDTGVFPLRRLDELKRALVQRHEALLARYDAQFGAAAYDPLPLPSGALPITLGAGAGFQTKSLLYAIPDAEQVRYAAHTTLHAQFFYVDRRTGKAKGTYPVRPGSSLPAPYCFKRTEYHGRYYPYGRCALWLGD